MYDSLEHNWYAYLRGHKLTFVPNDPDQDFEAMADQCDGVVITGGDDSAIRRVTEIRLATAMLQRLKPVIGICHGSFLLSDIMGGTVSPCSDHMDTEHEVISGTDHILVNSFHTQTITKLHSTGTSLATDSSGQVEAWIDKNIAGVTWHPQRMAQPWLPNPIAGLLEPKPIAS